MSPNRDSFGSIPSFPTKHQSSFLLSTPKVKFCTLCLWPTWLNSRETPFISTWWCCQLQRRCQHEEFGMHTLRVGMGSLVQLFHEQFQAIAILKQT